MEVVLGLWLAQGSKATFAKTPVKKLTGLGFLGFYWVFLGFIFGGGGLLKIVRKTFQKVVSEIIE